MKFYSRSLLLAKIFIDKRSGSIGAKGQRLRVGLCLTTLGPYPRHLWAFYFYLPFIAISWFTSLGYQ
ncbi:Uncharacterized protein HZ326_20327 [Fusarium oxysporum f. sp. albedinis]|nr:Uncharacterized protein HZ326_20327 [Fusarium oxysporum f. sp. albedinis]